MYYITNMIYIIKQTKEKCICMKQKHKIHMSEKIRSHDIFFLYLNGWPHSLQREDPLGKGHEIGLNGINLIYKLFG